MKDSRSRNLQVYEKFLTSLPEMAAIDGICCEIVHPIIEETLKEAVQTENWSEMLSRAENQVDACLSAQQVDNLVEHAKDIPGIALIRVADSDQAPANDEDSEQDIALAIHPDVLEELFQAYGGFVRLADRAVSTRLGLDETRARMPRAFIVMYAAFRDLLDAMSSDDEDGFELATRQIIELVAGYGDLLEAVGLTPADIYQRDRRDEPDNAWFGQEFDPDNIMLDDDWPNDDTDPLDDWPDGSLDIPF